MAKLKVFCLGWQKTATTSIGLALGDLGYAVAGWNDRRSAQMVIRWHEGRTSEVVDFGRFADAFEDFPWPLVYREVDRAFPNARFILTTRREDSWLKSVQRHIASREPWVGHFLIYGSYDPVADSGRYLERYREHNRAVMEYFADRPDKLLVMPLEEGLRWGPLCRFLGLDMVPRLSFPYANRAA